VDLPVGNYTDLITATTNGSFSMMSERSSAISSSTLDEATELWALPPNGESFVPLALYPIGFDTNGFTIINASQSQVDALTEAAMALDTPAPMVKSGKLIASDSSGGGVSPAFSGGSSQSSRAPTRPPTNPVKGRAGVYGVAYDTYSANGSGFTLAPPLNGILTQHVGLEGNSAGTSTFLYPPLAEYKKEANGFIQGMKKGNWSQGFAKTDDKFSINDLRGSGTIYNGVKLGLILLHGTYGTTADFNANQVKQMYFPITAGHGATYLRMSEMNFGSSATNGLKWMAIAACNSLFHTDWTSMQNGGIKPYNSNLHALLGTDTVVYTDDHIMQLWAQYMTKGKGTNTSPMTIKTAWITAAQDAYAQTGFPYANTMKFAVANDTSCTSDTLNTNSAPGGTWTYTSQQVWP
jgi:hypothetical protein